MKKLIAIVTLLLAFSINANAQKKQTPLTSREKGIKDAVELTKSLELTETQNANIAIILEQKYQTLENKDLSDERKTALSQAVDAQIKASLNPVQTEKFKNNKDLYERIIH